MMDFYTYFYNFKQGIPLLHYKNYAFCMNFVHMHGGNEMDFLVFIMSEI